MEEFKEYDWVEVTVEKDEYAKEGVHKGMFGWISDPRTIDETRLVDFPQCGYHRDITSLAVKKTDMRVTHSRSVLKNELMRMELGENEPGEILIVEVTVENDEYAKEGVHKGMQGVVYIQNDNALYTYFVTSWRTEPFADIVVSPNDTKELERMNPEVNERIKAEWDGKF